MGLRSLSYPPGRPEDPKGHGGQTFLNDQEACRVLQAEPGQCGSFPG